MFEVNRITHILLPFSSPKFYHITLLVLSYLYTCTYVLTYVNIVCSVCLMLLVCIFLQPIILFSLSILCMCVCLCVYMPTSPAYMWVLAFRNMGHKWSLKHNLDFWSLLVHKLPSHCRSTGLMDMCYWIQLFIGSGIGTQGLMLARGAFSSLSYLPSLDWVWEEVPSIRHFPAIKHSTGHQIQAIIDRLWQEACYW